MLLKISVLLLVPLFAGLLLYLLPKGRRVNFKLLLVFAGAYLFSITVIHILPELYHQPIAIELTGLFVLAGFFLQQVLEYFTAGIEHGHVHHDHHHHHGHRHAHGHLSAMVLLLALCVHAFLEGAMLAEPVATPAFYDLNAVLLGIALHRAPAAFALMTVLQSQLHDRNKALPYLIVFSAAAPVGLLLSTYFTQLEILSSTALICLYALVSGNFLHISTTIVFESSPEHKFNGKRMAVAVLGALVAVLVEYMI